MKPPSRSSRATGPKMRVPRGLFCGVDDHGGVLVEGDVGAVVAPELLLRAHDDRLDDLALLDRPLRVGLLDGGGDDVPHARVAAAGAALHADAEDLAGAGVVGDLQAGLVLDHLARSSDFDQPPALAARHRAALTDAHGVAGVGVVALVVGVQLDRGAHDLVVALVAPHDVDAHGDRLVGLVGDDDALAHLRAAGAVLGRVVGLGAGCALRALGLLGLGARAVAAPLGGGVLAARLALGARAPRACAGRAACGARRGAASSFSRRVVAAGAAGFGLLGRSLLGRSRLGLARPRRPRRSAASASAPRRSSRVRLSGVSSGVSAIVDLSSRCHGRVDAALAGDGQRAREVALGARACRRCSPARRWRAAGAGRTRRAARSRCARAACRRRCRGARTAFITGRPLA